MSTIFSKPLPPWTPISHFHIHYAMVPSCLPSTIEDLLLHVTVGSSLPCTSHITFSFLLFSYPRTFISFFLVLCLFVFTSLFCSSSPSSFLLVFLSPLFTP